MAPDPGAEPAIRTDVLVTGSGAPAMARFVERHSPLRFVPCVNYPDYHPALPGASPGGRALDIAPVELARLTPLARSVRTSPGYVPLTHDEWERW
jgi:3-oxosteroid 1-dehydrogenase